MASGTFVHLHTHTEYSLLDGACRIKDMVKLAKAQGMPAVAITDHGVMFGALEFYDVCKAEGIKPLIGCEVYMAPRRRTDRDPMFDKEQYHLVLLAQNLVGYRNLLKLVSTASLEGFYYKPRIDRELLEQHSEGIIALSACLGGQVPNLIMKGDLKQARELVGWMSEIFPDRYYLELQNHGIPEQAEVNRVLIQMAKEMKLPLVATNDLHYLRKEDAHAHDVLLCIQTNTTIDDEKRMRFHAPEFYFKSEEEMLRCFPECPEAIYRTAEVAERCNLELEFKEVLPHYEVPSAYTYESYLEKLCRDHLPEKYPNMTPELEARLKFELNVIQEKGFSAYFLIVNDFVQYARSQGILAQARGSAAGCMVTYLLGISSVDPVENDLMFERFLRIDGKKMPDIDVDFCDTRREEVLQYVVRKYGADRVAQIVTFGTMGPKAAVRDAGRALNVPRSDVDRVCKLLPTQPNSPTLAQFLETIPEFKAEYEGDPQIRNLIDTAQGIEGLCRHASTHAAGVVISKLPLTDVVPLQRTGDSPLPTTQYDFHGVEEVGLLKMDFLGLSFLTVINKAFQLIENTEGRKLTLSAIPMDDERTYQMLTNGDASGVFQVESSGMRQLLRDLKPHEFKDITPLIALYRPGPLQSGMVQDFINRRHGRAEVTYPHALLEPVLKGTYGIILYQEQVMRISMALADFNAIQAEALMKAMSKKKKAVMEEYRPLFIAGAKKKGVPEATAEHIYELMANFAKYGFNKSHSTAYSQLMYQTAWLKCTYPVQYLAALLTAFMDNKEKVVIYIEECRRLGIQVLPPDVNESEADFAVVPNPNAAEGGHRFAIRFALVAIKNVSGNIIQQMVEERANGPYRSLFDFCARLGQSGALNRSTVECLINSGACDCFGARRSQMIAVLDQAIAQGQRARREKEIGQFSMLDLLNNQSEEETPVEEALPEVPEFPKEKLLAAEKDLLGLYLSDHPVMVYRPALRRLRALTTQDVHEREDKEVVKVGGIIARTRRMTTRKGDTMMFVTLEDWLGSVEVIVWPSVLQEYGEVLQQDAVVVVEGKVSVRDNRNDDSDEEESMEHRQVEILADSIQPVKKSNSNAGQESGGMLTDGGRAYQGNGSAAAVDNAPRKPTGDPVIVRVPWQQMRADTLHALQSTILRYPGERRLLLHVEAAPGDGYTIECQQTGIQAAPELVSSVEQLLGPNCMHGI